MFDRQASRLLEERRRDLLATPIRSTLSLLMAIVILTLALTDAASAQSWNGGKKQAPPDKFRQLEELLPTPNTYRTASGAPGVDYWQQRADYVISVEIDDDAKTLTGQETITYHNNSPDRLSYLWVQLEQNIFAKDSDSSLTRGAPSFERQSYSGLRAMFERQKYDGAMRVTAVRDAIGNPLSHTIVKTMMRVDLPEPLASGQSVTFSIDWNYNINNTKFVRSRTGYEPFEEDGNSIYELAHWFPRMAAYTDVNGWQHKQFLGSGEFTLEFGNYLVRITVPDDHIVSATGVLQNQGEVLTDEQRLRLERSRTAKEPMFIVTPEEAKANESTEPTGKKTWIFRAQDVRDFAFATSRKFIWDAQGVDIEGRTVMAMSFYPNEGEPLWSRYSTQAVAHTLEVYSRLTFPYPYPVAQSVNGPVGGMEYPMICFNGPRPAKDGTYSSRSKYGLIGVVIHEVGHNWFPMIVNSDERQWTWMDEGLNTFVQFIAQQEWEDDYPGRRGEPKYITGFMKSDRQMPIMTNSESLLQFGSNAYAKPATALNILRETVMGRELFDFAFKEYSRRWMFKRPQPADLFRTLEDASGIDLDWFWRGWFYTTDHVNLGITGVSVYTVDTGNPDVEKPRRKKEREQEPITLTRLRNQDLEKRTHRFPALLDFYNEYDDLDITDKERRDYEKMMDGLEDWQKDMLAMEKRFCVVEFENKGGLVMPIIFEVEYADGTTEEFRVPAEIWRRNSETASKLVIAEKDIVSVTLDPHLETADVDRSDNVFPPRPEESKFKIIKSNRRWGGGSNPMRDAKKAAEKKKKDEEKAEKDEAIEGAEDISSTSSSQSEASGSSSSSGRDK